LKNKSHNPNYKRVQNGAHFLINVKIFTDFWIRT